MKVTQADIAEKVGVDRTSVNKVLNRYPRHNISPETAAEIWKVARELGYDFKKIRRDPERRKYPRTPVEMDVDVEILLEDDTVYDKGRARVRDLSLSGVRLCDLATEKRSLPIDNFRCRLKITEAPLEGLNLEGVFMRMQMGGTVEFGIVVRNLEREDKDRLVQYLEEGELELES